MEHMEDFAELAGIEFVRIDEETNIPQLRREMVWSDAAYKLR
jgi:L-arabinose isomerase